MQLLDMGTSRGAFELRAVAARMVMTVDERASEVAISQGPFVSCPAMYGGPLECNIPLSYLVGGRPDWVRELHATAAAKRPEASLHATLQPLDWIRTGPRCPRLPRLGLLRGAAVDSLLAPGVGSTLRDRWRHLADEARLQQFEGDIWPRISRMGRWQGPVLYRMKGGWTAESAKAPLVRTLLEGTLRTERTAAKWAGLD